MDWAPPMLTVSALGAGVERLRATGECQVPCVVKRQTILSHANWFGTPPAPGRWSHCENQQHLTLVSFN